MDTATCEDGVWIIRAMRSFEIDVMEEMVALLANVIKHFVILPQSAEAIGVTGAGGWPWDFNIDTCCRRLHQHSVAFMHPHSLEKLELDDENRALGISRNTQIFLDVFRRSLRSSNFMTRRRSCRLWRWQHHNCDTF